MGWEKGDEKECGKEVKEAKERLGESYCGKVHAFVAAACGFFFFFFFSNDYSNFYFLSLGNEHLFKYLLATNLLPPNSSLSSTDALPPSSDYLPSAPPPEGEMVLDLSKLTSGKMFSDVLIERYLLEGGEGELEGGEFEQGGELELVGTLSRLSEMMVKYYLVLHHQKGLFVVCSCLVFLGIIVGVVICCWLE